ncbi:MAG: GAF domain-containing protein [Ignavibacteria bacterium]|nr:GAF domain-containing protein [Ignavibacteria bacterium]
MDFDNIKAAQDSISMESTDENPAQYHSILLDLKKMDKTDLHEFMRKVLDVVANALDIERVSIWFFNEDRTSIYCDYLYLKKFGEYANETTLEVKDYPSYFKAIETNLSVAIDDALTDPVTRELAEDYLKPRGICSIMDIPIHYHGETIGIICHEEQDKIRHWKREEMDFTAAISSLVSTSLEIDYRKGKERDFHESQRFLSTLISNLPGYVYRVNKEGEAWSIQYISDGVFDLSGYSPKELIRNKVLYYSMMVNEFDKSQAKVIISSALAAKKPYQINYRICTAEGKLKWVWEQGRGVYSEKGELIATEGFVTDITEKKLFEEEILKKNNELSALYHFGKSLSKLAEPAMIIEDIGTMLGKLFNSPNIYLALYNEPEQRITYPFYLKAGISTEHESRPFANAFTEFVIRSRKGVILNEHILASLKLLGVTGSSIEAKSLISAPMTAGEKVLGVITIQDFEKENAFTQNQLELLTTVGSQAAIALENSYLYSEVTKQLREKEILLQEVHHRVKNNLQVMSSLIKLQARYIKDEKMLDLMKETGGRIQSMAIVHTKLYNSGNYEFINFGEYVKNLIESFQNTYGYKLRNIKFETDISDIIINIDTAIPSGLIINELISNSIKYAFPGDAAGTIAISLHRIDGGKLNLVVKDNGTGVDEGIDLSKADSLGIQLVTLLTRQMNGTLNVKSSKGSGTLFDITFEEAVYKARK